MTDVVSLRRCAADNGVRAAKQIDRSLLVKRRAEDKVTAL